MNKRKGFTLIELLAVIVILGLLMAIAIPSVTKYITESRKKTVVSTIGNYITAMVNEVNDLTYTFTAENTIYAVPIECIALERGGTNPFGAWHQASNAYWAYVLVQYDDETSSYRYGYTFKDSAGYGLYPTAQSKLNEQGKQIQTGLSLSRPKIGKVTNITAVDNWNGFNVDSSTDLVVLVAEKEGNIGDGETTCTLQQKGNNYEEVEQGKTEEKEEETLSGNAYAIYSASDKSLTFVRSDNEIKTGDTYNGKTATAVYTGFESDVYSQSSMPPWNTYASTITTITIADEIKPISVSWWFSNMSNVTTIDVSKINTSNVTTMIATFAYCYKLKTVTGLENWNTSNVTNMNSLFGEDYDLTSISGLENWNTSKVVNMASMFQNCFDINGFTAIQNWDTSSVVYMQGMFLSVGSAVTISLDLSKWDVSKVTDMSYMFAGCVLTSINLSNWDTSSAKNMSYMFNSNSLTEIDLTSFNTSKVTDMTGMFEQTTTLTVVYATSGKWVTTQATTTDMFNRSKIRRVTYK